MVFLRSTLNVGTGFAAKLYQHGVPYENKRNFQKQGRDNDTACVLIGRNVDK
jgi:hypothetical protein